MQRRSGVAALISSSEREDGRECIASNITELIGWTPLLELKQITKKDGVDVRLVGKLESYQPLSSVKDRGALRMIEDAEEKGFITPGITTLVEPTSGNLGISLACIAAQKGYKFIAVMPNHFSLERRILLKYLGADIKLTDSKLGFQGQLEKLDQLKANIPNVYVLDQFSNPANPAAHFSSTGPEIWEDTEGKIDIFVCGSGSGGTLSGAGSYLRMKKPSLKIICVEPSDSPVISGFQHNTCCLCNFTSLILQLKHHFEQKMDIQHFNRAISCFHLTAAIGHGKTLVVRQFRSMNKI
uniref:Cysteine synthase n=1 Tax=Anthurium amnicola TaxID=1678845 RepID=A0A1D1YH96_9ARAE